MATFMVTKPNDLVSFPLHLSHDVQSMFGELIHQPWGFCREIRGWSPEVDLYETDAVFVLEADLPGVEPDHVKVEVVASDLVLQGSRSLEKSESVGRFHVMERSSGHFIRHIRLPETVDKDAIGAEFHDGVLRVILPKSREVTGEAK